MVLITNRHTPEKVAVELQDFLDASIVHQFVAWLFEARGNIESYHQQQQQQAQQPQQQQPQQHHQDQQQEHHQQSRQAYSKMEEVQNGGAGGSGGHGMQPSSSLSSTRSLVQRASSMDLDDTDTDPGAGGRQSSRQAQQPENGRSRGQVRETRFGGKQGDFGAHAERLSRSRAQAESAAALALSPRQEIYVAVA